MATMKRETALNLKPGAIVHCHATNNQGVLNKAPYVNDEGQVVLPCASWDQLYLINPDRMHQWDDIESYDTSADLLISHTSSTAVKHSTTHPCLDYTFDSILYEFVQKAHAIYERMGWQLFNRQAGTLALPSKTELHDMTYELAEHCLKGCLESGARTHSARRARVYVVLSGALFEFLIAP